VGKKDTRQEFNSLIHKLQKAAAEDKHYGNESEVDHLAIGRLKARELVDLVDTHRINLSSLFREYNYRETQHLEETEDKNAEKIQGKTGKAESEPHTACVASADFLVILKSMQLGWSEEEYMDIIELLSQPGKKIKEENGHSKKMEPRVSIKHLMAFETHFSDRVVVMATVVCFILYPTIVKNVFLSLSCTHGLMDGEAEWYLNRDMDISCTSVGHIAFILCVGVPCLIGFVIGYPFAVLFSVWRSRKKHNRLSETTSLRYAVFVSGYRSKIWYWEGITCVRKVLLSLVAVFLGSFGPEKQFFFASLLLVVTMVFQLHMKPFENRQLNSLETSGLGFLWLTLYFGIFFYWQLLTDSELDILGVFIVLVNVGFILWAFGSVFAEYLTFYPEGRQLLGCLGSKSNNPLFLAASAIPGILVLWGLSVLRCCKTAKKEVVFLAHMGADKVDVSELVDPLEALSVQVKEMKVALGTHHLELQGNHEYKLEMQRLLSEKRRKEQEALLNTKRLAVTKARAEADAQRRRKEKREKDAQFRENVSNMFNFGGDSSSEDEHSSTNMGQFGMFGFESSDSESDGETFDLSMGMMSMSENQVQLGEKSAAHKKLEAEFEAHKRKAEARVRAKEAEMMAKIAELEAKLSGGKKKKQAAPKAELGFGDLHDNEEENRAGKNRGLLSFDDDNEAHPGDAPKNGSLSFEALGATGTSPAGQKKENILSMDTLVAVKSSAVTDTTPAAGSANNMLELSAMLGESSDSGSDSQDSLDF
jgi:hypothetical protein